MKNALLTERGILVAKPVNEIAATVTGNCKCKLIQTLIAMKLLLLLITAVCLQAGAKGYSQSISLNLKNVPLEKVFAAIQQQSNYQFIYTKEEMKDTRAVSIEVIRMAVADVLDLCLKEQPVTYTLQEPYIIIKRKEENKAKTFVVSNTTINGKVTNERGEPVAGATITIKGTGIATACNEKGEYILNYTGNYAVIKITSVGYETQEISINGRNYINITLQTAINSLDETIVIAYGHTTRRLNTGNIGKISAEEISRQPVSNPLATLQGRVPSLLITQSSGLNGAALKVQIRGQNSLIQGSEPFYIIDGVPFAPGNAAINQLSNATDKGPNPGLSPFSLINPADIESIEILKDADATAIYGSRGANGVIIITTKKGKAGKTKFSLNIHSGASTVTRTMDMLDLKEYLQMRREGFANDGITPTASNAPDLLLWDTTRNTDIKKLLIGGTARNTDAQFSISGGSNTTQFLMAGGYHRQTTVFPTDLADHKASFHFNLNHSSSDKKFSLALSGIYSFNKNQLTVSDLTGYIRLPPNFKLFDADGKLNWEEGGIAYRDLGMADPNPFSYLYEEYNGQFHNIVANAQLSYKLTEDIRLKANMGYNIIFADEVNIYPAASIDPYSTNQPNSAFGNSTRKTWIIEPQVEYRKSIKKGILSILAGSTWQENIGNGTSIEASGYTSDIFLRSLAGAGYITASNNYSQYRYAAVFGRVNFNWSDKYIINLTARRDGSGRFGPANRFSNFGAAGAAWMFSSEPYFRKAFPFISFGKLRGSYGITGNDQIGDYKFLDTWAASSVTYQGTSTLSPTALFNPDYAWEVNKKAEAAVDIGLFKDRILLAVSWFSNRCSNQLVNYPLPIQTGFSSIGKNLDALITNQGTEIQVTSKNIVSGDFSWSSSFNITFHRNKLLKFPGLSISGYASVYTIGKSLSTKKLYHYLGVDPASGIYQFEDVDRNGVFNLADAVILTSPDPSFYGGLGNSISFKGFRLDIFFEFRKQKGRNYLASIETPGYSFTNQPKDVLKRWRQQGDMTSVQRFTASSGPAFTAVQNYLINSGAAYRDASFLRCKNVAIEYGFPAPWLKSLHLERASLFMYAQNLFTITKYLGADPENQDLFILPPLKTITAGINLNF